MEDSKKDKNESVNNQLEEAKKNISRYKKAQEIGQIGNWEYDIQSGTFWGSDEGKRIYGFDPEATDFTSEEVYRCVVVEDRERVQQAMVDLIEHGKEYNIEFQIIPRNATETRILWSLAEVKNDEKGNLLYVAGVLKDITEKKKIDDSLRHSEEKYRTLFTTMTQGVVYQDAGGKIITANPAAERILGLTLDQMQGRTSMDPQWKAIYADGSEMPGDMHPNMIALRTGKEVRNMVQGIYHPNKDSYVWISVNAVPLFRPGENTPYQVYAIFDDITMRRLAEEALQESRSRLEFALQGGQLGIWDWDIQTGTVVYSDLWAKMLEYSPDEVEPTVDFFKHHIHPDDQKSVIDRLTGHIEGRFEIYESEHRIRTKSGKWLWILDRGKITEYDKEGRPARATGIIADITTRKKTENKLQESEERFRTLMEKIDTVAVQGYGPDGTTQYWNAASERLYGYSRQEAIGRNLLDLIIPSEMKDAVVKEMRKMVESGQPIPSGELLLMHKDGSRVPVISHHAIVKVPGREQELFCLDVDITARKEAEESLVLEKERLSVTLQCIGDGVIATNTKGSIVLLNKKAEEMTGWSTSEAAGKPLAEVFNIINELTRRECENPVTKVLATGNIVELANHTALVTRDKREIIIADSAAPIKNTNGEIIGVVLVFRDMTEKKKMEKAVEVSSKLESLGVLAGGIAHDFNNLLGGIYGYIEMASISSKDEKVTGYLSKTITTIERARDLTGQLLTFAKGGAPVQKIAPLFPFVQETAQFALSGSNVSCDFDVQQDLWNCNYDSNQVGQVIDNIIINAQQAMPLGGTINVSARNISLAEKDHLQLAKGEYVRISIEDSGIGIPKELLYKIFDPFFTTKTKGHGLGLATCYSIINRHGGCINVYSEQGKGSVFHVYLPAAKESVSDLNKKIETQHKGSGTFLVMDDEEVMQETISHVLSSLGYTVVCKDNGKDAVDYVASELNAERLLSGMIFDLTVPGGMGGKDAVSEIRKLNIKTPVFVVSGYADDPVMKNPEEYGFTASICKPFRKIELIEMLGKHIKTGN